MNDERCRLCGNWIEHRSGESYVQASRLPGDPPGSHLHDPCAVLWMAHVVFGWSIRESAARELWCVVQPGRT